MKSLMVLFLAFSGITYAVYRLPYLTYSACKAIWKISEYQIEEMGMPGFSFERCPHGWILFKQQSWDENLKAFFHDPVGILKTHGQSLGGKSTTRLAYFIEIGKQKYVVKTDYFCTRKKSFIRRLLNHSKVVREWNNAARLQKLGISSQKNIALYRYKDKNFLIVEFIDGEDGQQLMGDFNSLKEMKKGDKLAKLMYQLRDRRVIHGDLTMRNVFFTSDGNPILIDLETLFVSQRNWMHYERYRREEIIKLLNTDGPIAWRMDNVSDLLDSYITLELY